MKPLTTNGFWIALCGAALFAISAATPTLMNSAMHRGTVIMKLFVAAPLALLACGAASGAMRWRDGLPQDRLSMLSVGAVCLLALIALLGSATAAEPMTAVLGGYFRLEGLVAWTAYVTFLFALTAWVRNTGRAREWVDMTLIACVVPACYALQQRLGYDFLVVAFGDPERVGSTQGNPVQLGGYLAILVPATLARIWSERGNRWATFLGCCVLVLQLFGLWSTQARGPLLALILGLTVLGFLGAAYARSRAIFLVVATGLAGLSLAVVVMNTSASLGQWAQEVPYLGRLALVSSGAAQEPGGALRSALARQGLWQAGVQTFAAAPLGRQLFGYGPESASAEYFPHVPASVVRTEDPRTIAIFDRLHADVLDLGLSFGVLGWLAYAAFFCALIFAAARALFGLGGPGPLRLYLALVVGGAALGPLGAQAAGLGSAWVPGIGLGIAAGWMLFLSVAAWRCCAHGLARDPVGRRRWALIAGATTSELVFWIDAQVNVASLTARLISFGMAAILLALCATDTANGTGKPQRLSGADPLRLGLVCAVLAAFASFLPAISLAAEGGRIADLPLRTLALFPLLLMAGVVSARPWSKAPRASAKGALAFLVLYPCLFLAAHYVLRVSIDPAFGPAGVQGIAEACVIGPCMIGVACVGWAWLASGRKVRDPDGDHVPRRLGVMLFGMVVIAVGIAFAGWRTLVADVAASSARWPLIQAPRARAELIRLATRALPHEWQYRRELIYELLGQALNRLGADGTDSERYAAIRADLDAAEQVARESLADSAHDPWRLATLANVLQARALGKLRVHDPVGGSAAAAEADALYALAHRRFPVQPEILRNWAQLKFDTGQVADGYRLLDMMEELIPNQPDAYVERIRMARRLGDAGQESSAIMRAMKMLNESRMEVVRSVAKKQR